MWKKWIILIFKTQCTKCNLFAAESSPSPSAKSHLIPRVVKAGSAVVFNCTLDAECIDQSAKWTHNLPYDTKTGTWYRSPRLNPTLVARNVTVDEDASRGWSVLSIPSVRLGDRGSFRCFVDGLQHCQMNFQLTVTGNISTIIYNKKAVLSQR